MVMLLIFMLPQCCTQSAQSLYGSIPFCPSSHCFALLRFFPPLFPGCWVCECMPNALPCKMGILQLRQSMPH
ncbi:hypothetical protein B0J12DRAFT_644651 [Macrophomina phaseolina]|uniref:Secreted protein n=1 Tax=Macrophomina phaseolina TaxID=35725 RepID=A0ABQ8GPW7_9PEZI|nr:hypothetical protein B0J12DRAFT_644651 [Macrophomina phaseolina]